MKSAIVLGAGGFIGGHLAYFLKDKGFYVVGVDIKESEFRTFGGDQFILADLRDYGKVEQVIPENVDQVYQLAADMGGSTYINTGDHDADVMSNSCLININVLKRCAVVRPKQIFYSSSACVYPEHNQLDPNNPICTEPSAYPADPDSEYGWEKLFSERLYLTFARNYGLDVRIARFHNIFGPYGTFSGGREKAPAALCRKVANCYTGDIIEVYGDGLQTRSFLYIDECLEGIWRLMKSMNFKGPVNIGSERLISINDLARLIIQISGKNIKINNVAFKGVGVRGRNSDNTMIREKLSWRPEERLEKGLELTYHWIKEQLD